MVYMLCSSLHWNSMLYVALVRAYHRYLKNIDCSSFVMCPLLAPHLPFFAFFAAATNSTYETNKAGKHMPLISLSFLDVCGAYMDEATNGTIKPFTAFSDYV